MGLNLEEIGLMYVGTFFEMFEEYKTVHNMKVKGQIYVVEDLEVADPAEAL